MKWLLLFSVCCLMGCPPTCKNACEKVYSDIYCGFNNGVPEDIMMDACRKRCRMHKTSGTARVLDTGSGTRIYDVLDEGPLSEDYTWVDCTMEHECAALGKYPDPCEMEW